MTPNISIPNLMHEPRHQHRAVLTARAHEHNVQLVRTPVVLQKIRNAFHVGVHQVGVLLDGEEAYHRLLVGPNVGAPVPLPVPQVVHVEAIEHECGKVAMIPMDMRRQLRSLWQAIRFGGAHTLRGKPPQPQINTFVWTTAQLSKHVQKQTIGKPRRIKPHRTCQLCTCGSLNLECCADQVQ